MEEHRNFTLKTALDDDIRRFAWKYGANFDALFDCVRKNYQIETAFQIKYRDEDDDLVTISNEEEFAEALRGVKSSQASLLRLTILRVGAPGGQPQSQQPSASQAAGAQPYVPPSAVVQDYDKFPSSERGQPQQPATEQAVHLGVQCDGCGQHPIIGARWNSTRLHNFDLCSGCKDRTTDQHFQLMAAPAAVLTGCRGAPQPPFNPCGFGRYRSNNSNNNNCGSGAWRCGAGKQPHNNNNNNNSNNGNTAGNNNKLHARFVRDVSIFDGTEVAGGTPFSKIWKVRNEGSVAWPEGSLLLHVGGDGLSARSINQACSAAVAPGQEIDVCVDLVAPTQPGRYTAFFRLATPSFCGRKFGQRMWCTIVVSDPKKEQQHGCEAAGSSSSSDAPIPTPAEQHQQQPQREQGQGEQVGSQLDLHGLANELQQLIRPDGEMLDQLPPALLAVLDALAPVAEWAESEASDASEAPSLVQLLQAVHRQAVSSLSVAQQHLCTASTPMLAAAAEEALQCAQQLLGEGPTAPEFEAIVLRLATQDWPALQSMRQVLQQPAVIRSMASQLSLLLRMVLASGTAGADSVQQGMMVQRWAAMMSQSPLGSVLGIDKLFGGGVRQPSPASGCAQQQHPAQSEQPSEEVQVPAEEERPSAQQEAAGLDTAQKAVETVPMQQEVVEQEVVEQEVVEQEVVAGGEAELSEQQEAAAVEQHQQEGQEQEQEQVVAAVEQQAEEQQQALPEMLPAQPASSDADTDGQRQQAELEQVLQQLQGMGYADQALLKEVIAKNTDQDQGAIDLSECVHDLTLLAEWDYLLDDLDEMGFENREVNRSLLLHNKGNIKKVVHELVKST